MKKYLRNIFWFFITSLLLYFALENIYNSFCKDSVKAKEQNIIIASSEFIRIGSPLNHQYQLFVIDTNLGREKLAYQIEGIVPAELLRGILLENGFAAYNSYFQSDDAFSFSKNGYIYLIESFTEKNKRFLVIEKENVFNQIYPFFKLYMCVKLGKPLGSFFDILGTYIIGLFVTIYSFHSLNRLKN